MDPPLKGIRVLEFAGLAPGPFAGLMLADAGASVLRVDRATPASKGGPPLPTPDLLTRHKSSIAVDLKSRAGIALLHSLTKNIDVLIDPFRPGVLERHNLGPQTLLALNPRLIYARLTGFRRDGRYAAMAGHDINYLAVSGALAMLGRSGAPPHPPINLLADFAGGGAMLVQGVLMALVARCTSGRGQVVEANMVDGVSYLATFPRFALKTPVGAAPRGENLLDGGCPYYDSYVTADGGYMAVGALEPQFFAALVRGLGLQGRGWEEARMDRARWGEMRRVFGEVFRTKTREEWEAVFDGTDACCTPVLEYGELERDLDKREGDPRPAVSLKGTPWLEVSREDGYRGKPLVPGQGGKEVLEDWCGWREGREYVVDNGGVVLNETAKL
ncbi:CoA-transferase family III domain-containing protein [Echria macrotheca]|uniref:CoA-transferase family III domain-containing protein n=1 Tax=Echria macrotheca TaxID=438768 RepID=A0AAJ0BR37_9PEZI|nr:CoA-transferase family III domain-containing protein [Echria macrotheca]